MSEEAKASRAPCFSGSGGGGMAEVDTSPPFESVKEAVSWFDGIGPWAMPPPCDQASAAVQCQSYEDAYLTQVQMQTAALENDVIVKERETLRVLEELEATRRIVNELKAKLQKKQTTSFKVPKLSANDGNFNHLMVDMSSRNRVSCLSSVDSTLMSASSPGCILMELKQAKLNLNRTNCDLADIRASIEALNKDLEKERISLQKSRERLTLNCAEISSLEEELHKTRLKLRLTEAIHNEVGESSVNISRELHQVTSEAEHFRRITEMAKCEVSKAMFEIENTKMSIQTAEIRWLAAKKMEEAAKAAEAVALAEMQAVTKGNYLITLSYNEYASLVSRAQEAEALSRKRIDLAMAEVDEAELSKRAILKKVEEASEEVKISTKALEEALNRVGAANKGKQAVEEAIRKWRLEHGRKCQSVHNNSLNSKSPLLSQHKKKIQQFHCNHLNNRSDGSNRILKSTRSIGDILGKKLLPEEFGTEGLERNPGRQKVSLGQMLDKEGETCSPPNVEKSDGHDQYTSKRNKHGFRRGFALLLTRQDWKKEMNKKHSVASM